MFLIGTDNVVDYLIEKKVCQVGEVQQSKIEPKIFKNFNLLIHLSSERSLFVKQEMHNQSGQTNGDFSLEWQLHQFLQSRPELADIQALTSEVIEADLNHSILIFNYLKRYIDLDTFYTQNQHFPLSVATALGNALATLHRATFNQAEYRAALSASDDSTLEQVPDFTHGLEFLTPEIFGTVSTAGLKFYQLYQRHPELGQALASLRDSFTPCCLTHNDLKFANILLHTDWNGQPPEAPIRLIDWEKWSWGDPASDLGMVLAEFLKIWLKSLTVSPDLDMHLSLRSATTPLEKIQPSMVAFVQAYLRQFPELRTARPQLITQVLQLTGFALIESIQAKLHYLEPFGNVGICILQVAKTLLCEPEQSISVVFGNNFPDLIHGSLT
ncbi:MAG: phosphotransferase [Cyanobacteria bacterium RM1_2_2]|nr:phosphotransferase [Cyanobacteria bacterium RM1_2_2]